MTGTAKLIVIIISITAMTSLCACHTTVNINTPAKVTDASNAVETDREQETGEEIETKIYLPELETVKFDLTQYGEDGKRKIFESYGNSYLANDMTREVYPDLSAALDAIDQNEKDLYNQTINDSKEDAEEFAKEQDEYGEDYSFFRYNETQLCSLDDKVVSLLRTEYGYLGGAHPDYFYQTFNLDVKTGEEILLSDIITDKTVLKDVLIDKLNAQYPDGNFFGLDESLSMFELDPESEDPDQAAYMFTIDPLGLCFYFGPYDLNSYADGSQQIEVYYDDIRDILKSGFVYENFGKDEMPGEADEPLK